MDRFNGCDLDALEGQIRCFMAAYQLPPFNKHDNWRVSATKSQAYTGTSRRLIVGRGRSMSEAFESFLRANGINYIPVSER